MTLFEASYRHTGLTVDLDCVAETAYPNLIIETYDGDTGNIQTVIINNQDARRLLYWLTEQLNKTWRNGTHRGEDNE